MACVLLAACSGTPVKPSVPPPTEIATVLPPPPATPPAQQTPVPEISDTPASDAVESPWPHLRQRYAMPGCNYSPAVQRFAKMMAQSPRHLSAALRQAMPFVLIATAQIEKFDMPGEFAFLPWVESSYTMIPPNGDSAAGMWQLMPETARELGLRIDDEYDDGASTLTSPARRRSSCSNSTTRSSATGVLPTWHSMPASTAFAKP